MSADPYLPQPNYSRQQRGCRKAGYPTKKDAQTIINSRMSGRGRLRRNRPEQLHAYHCRWCGCWHLTKLDNSEP